MERRVLLNYVLLKSVMMRKIIMIRMMRIRPKDWTHDVSLNGDGSWNVDVVMATNQLPYVSNGGHPITSTDINVAYLCSLGHYEVSHLV